MTMHEDLLELSTAGEYVGGVLRYASAAHAVEAYLILRGKAESVAAIDYERMGDRVQVSPHGEGPHITRLLGAVALERAFEAAREKMSPKRWHAWCRARAHRDPLSRIKGVSESTAHRALREGDALVEEALAAARLLVRSRTKEVEG